MAEKVYSKQKIVALQRCVKTSSKFLKTASNLLVQQSKFRDHQTGAILFRIIISFFKIIFLRAPSGILARANLKCEGAKLEIQSATQNHPIFMPFLDFLEQKITKILLFLSKISNFSPFFHKRH